MFWNTCRLPEGWTVKNMKSKHQSRPHNPDIAKTFFLANMIETWGRGIRKMQEDCKTHGTPEPKIWGYKTDICVEFKNQEPDIKSKISTPKKAHKIIQKTREKTRMKAIEKTRVKTRMKAIGKTRVKTREKMVLFISLDPQITIKELAYKTELSIKGAEWQIQELKKSGRLKRIGPAKGGYWQIIKNQTK